MIKQIISKEHNNILMYVIWWKGIILSCNLTMISYSMAFILKIRVQTDDMV